MIYAYDVEILRLAQAKVEQAAQDAARQRGERSGLTRNKHAKERQTK